MSTTLTRWRDTAFGPLDWSSLLPVFSPEIRIEQYVDSGRYLVRAELPGFDPEKEIALTVADGLLRIQAERTELKRERAHSEFHYGQFTRSVALPAGATESTATAKYAEGVLEVSFEMGEPREAGKRIAIEIAKEHPTKTAKTK
jgi:HSP20 family protein